MTKSLTNRQKRLKRKHDAIMAKQFKFSHRRPSFEELKAMGKIHPAPTDAPQSPQP